jgi:hypothetical protein
MGPMVRPASCGLGLSEREILYVLDAKAKISALPESARPERHAYEGKGRPQTPRYRGPFSSLRELALSEGSQAVREVCWREGSRGAMRSHFVALRIRPANATLRRAACAAGEELPVCWLLAEWLPGESEPRKYWLSNLPEDTAIQRLVHLAKLRWRIEHDYRELKDALGLDHFEGCSWQGWHHHVSPRLPHPGATALPSTTGGSLTLFASCASYNSSWPAGTAHAPPATDDCRPQPPTSTTPP